MSMAKNRRSTTCSQDSVMPKPTFHMNMLSRTGLLDLGLAEKDIPSDSGFQCRRLMQELSLVGISFAADL